MRFDVSVNLLTLSALKHNKITVFGGTQIRPNVHIQDIASAYIFFLHNPNIRGVFNVGFENLSILDIAKLVQAKLDVPIEVTPSADPRSYRVSSDKLLRYGFEPKHCVDDAITEIIDAYKVGNIKDDDRWHNLLWMKKNNFHIES